MSSCAKARAPSPLSAIAYGPSPFCAHLSRAAASPSNVHRPRMSSGRTSLRIPYNSGAVLVCSSSARSSCSIRSISWLRCREATPAPTAMTNHTAIHNHRKSRFRSLIWRFCAPMTSLASCVPSLNRGRSTRKYSLAPSGAVENCSHTALKAHKLRAKYAILTLLLGLWRSRSMNSKNASPSSASETASRSSRSL